MLQGKTVLLGVTGGIAAYKMPNVARMLKKMHCNVHVLMTQNATNFITATTFETLTGNKCLIDTFDRNFEFSVEHVALAKQADIVLIAPATANVIGKIANGIADDMLTTTVMACTCKTLIAPAMNHNMYENPIVQDNLEKLKRFGYEMIPPVTGMLANGDIGNGKMPSEETLVEYVVRELAKPKDMAGMKVLVTAGPTQEAIDPVRYLTNHSTGKMGYALAKMAMLRGADVTLVTGPTALEPPMFVQVEPIVTAKEMYEKVTGAAKEQDVIIKAAAVADYRPATVATEKVKKKEGAAKIELERTDDILAALGAQKGNTILCGFSMETEHMLENSRAKLEKKNLDLIVANNLKVEGAGFGTDTNVLTIISKEKETQLSLMSKEDAADRVLDAIMELKTK
ncbi:bifunctional phosphopantothenoylcysteine decarboxylase/phosphopantothenate--cysteine ligase CoaBC [Roseburia sp. 831b]|uniref:bifunctional phosphopantothenoylcysteine decarboxylase/phosphopantothenate--cysteine ligase CoaBC n=1 Tax=Roseburia sp. 831b TaxID=1261635 RepID=UPI0009532C25|nr:bifunctional phosphopantothenoylcysteine decarboxylase/phosphopantothenate--cysteine ligase CoaBC [Roseburia sp. 831b]MDY5884644.1 bifunctional phosphopantothenoylcysteine decarboxylase/phosphopantothenate--cysteine ligase CoaBC [Roseburia sp.]WVK72200.1 bifunctional phosphopantothenoylcysteine decarboxylase/phosphopantothenate--cysteine ligase CoaBC [Roseburia sp. 831b]